MRRYAIPAGLLAALVVASTVVSAGGALPIQPGERQRLVCETGWKHVEVEPTEVVAVCQENYSPTPSSASLTPVPSVVETSTPSTTPPVSPPATVAPTATPTAAASPTAAPTASATATTAGSPTATPAPTPNAAAEVVGYGAGTVGGAGGRVIEVRNALELASALNASGARIVELVGSGEWNANGASLTIGNPNITVDGSRCDCYIRNGWLAVRASEVILRNLRVRTGDEDVSGGDADAISINGRSAGISNIVLDHVEAIWAPDVAGITILNNVRNVTVQHSIIGVGLLRSTHPEAYEDPDGHDLAFNIAGLSPDVAPANITVFANLILNSQGRNPRVQGASNVDLVNNVIYNYDEGPAGNPRSLNMVGNWLRRGPAAEAAGLGAPSTDIWRTQTSSDFPSVFRDSVFLADNVADGFSPTMGADSGVVRSSPASALSVSPMAGADVLSAVLNEVGPHPLDAISLEWINQVVTRTGSFVSGDGAYPPR